MADKEGQSVPLIEEVFKMVRGKRGRPKTVPDKTMVSFRFDEKLYERVQNACYHQREVLTHLIEQWMEQWVRSKEMQYNDGRPFPPPDN